MGPMTVETQYTDGWWQSPDGLKLHYRDYPGPKDRPPILCIPGLTRNARDFEPLAQRLAGDWRLICVSLRGRAESQSASDVASYAPPAYLADLEALISELKLKRFIAFGTSLGGVLTMLLAAAKPGRIAGAMLNDIGPDIERAGLDRIRAMVGKQQTWPTWVHAARDLAAVNADIYPDFALHDWIAMAKRTCRLTTQGRITPAYDTRIGDAMRADAPPADLWPAYEALGDVPVAIIRGALSDILSNDTAKAMARRLPRARLTQVPRVGHVPVLDEPAAVRAINALLKAASA